MTDSRTNPLVAVPLLLLAVLIYWPSLTGEFVVDDLLWARLPAPALGEVLSRAFFAWGFNESATGVAGPPIFRPVSNLLTGLEHWAFGDDPLPYRIAALLLHVANTLLVLALLARLFPAASLAARLWSGLVFLAHPALVESVAWISASAELFMTSFVLAAVLCFLRSVETRRASDRAAFAAFALAAILSKEASLALPPILMLVQFYRRAPLWVAETIGAVAMVGAYLTWRQLAIGDHGTTDALALAPVRALELALAHFRYLVLPGQQPFSIAPPGIGVAALAPILAALALLAGFLAWALRQRQTLWRPTVLGLGWMTLALWPAYAIALVGAGYFAGRHAYLPTVGLAIVLTAALTRLPAMDRRVSVALGVASIAALALLSLSASSRWATNVAAYQRATELSPQASGAWGGLGQAHLERQQFDEAAQAFLIGVGLVREAKDEQALRYGLALALAQRGRFAESSRQLERIIELFPDDSSAWNGLGNNAWASGRLDLAERYYREALRATPANHEARTNLAAVLRAQRQNIAP